MSDSYGQAFDVTKSDTADFRAGFISDALYIGGAGNVVAVMEDGKTVTFLNVPVGVFPIRCKRLLIASTVTNVLALKG